MRSISVLSPLGSGRRVASLVLILLVMTVVAAPSQAFFWNWGGWKPSRPKQGPNLVQLLEDDGRFGTLLFALDRADLVDTIENADALTIFAPTDEAFEAVPPEVLEGLLADKDALTNVLLYHVVGGSLNARHLSRLTTPVTLQGNPVVVVRDGRTFSVANNPIVDRDLRAKNGRVQVIESVLLPPEGDVVIESLVDVLALDGRFDTLIELVIEAGLAPTLIEGGPFTLFAPTDEAFDDLPEGTIDALKDDKDLLTEILLYHVLGEKRSSISLLASNGATTLQGGDVTVVYRDGGVFVNESEIINRDMRSPNARIHVIDAVLTPDAGERTVLDVLEENGYTTLLFALETAELTDALLSLGPVTIFAPTNEAFAKIPADDLNALLGDKEALTRVLLYHVLIGEEPLFDLLFKSPIETVEGSKVGVFWFFGPIVVNRSLVVDGNLPAPDAIVHGIDTVLTPPKR